MELLFKSVKYYNYTQFYQIANYSKQTGNAMKKIMGSGPKKKFKYSESPTLPTTNAFAKGAFEGRKSVNSRRVTVLNKTFMRYITDLMATGECSTEIVGLGLEVNKVQVTPDYKLLKVYWIGKGVESDENIEKVLDKNAGYLRHELSQLRVMGVVPKIEFVKDKHYANIVELDNRLKVADFGEEYIPIEPSLKLKNELELITPIEPEIREKIEKLDSEIVEEFQMPLPQMPQNILGLNHSEILNKITKLMKKSEALHRLSSSPIEDTFKLSETINEDPVHYSNHRAQRIAFKEFLQKRQIMRFKSKNNVDKNYLPDLEYLKEEFMEKQKQFLDSIDIPSKYLNDNDYIVEEEEK